MSCLTSSSTSSRDQNNANYPILVDSDNNSTQFTSTYLPQVIDPQEWHQQKFSRKRKERQDSTSSITQDRKLVRSNSEEYLPSVDIEVIRRVSSHEQIKNSLDEDENASEQLLQSEKIEDRVDGEVRRRSYHVADDVSSTKSSNNEVQEILRETYRRNETSPARSRTFDFSYKLRISPNRDANYDRQGINSGYDRDDDDEEQEQRRSTERFCRARAAQPSRKSTSAKKSTPLLPRQSVSADNERKLQEPNDISYKYDMDMSKLKSERRGFTSSKRTPTEKSHFDLESRAALLDDSNTMASNSDEDYNDLSSSLCVPSDNNNGGESSPRHPSPKPKHESLPWDHTQEDDVPVVSQRFADNKFAHVNNSRDIDMKVRNESVTHSVSIPHFAKENLKTRDIMKGNALPSVFASPDEKLKQISKRLTALKKRVATFEENFEIENGFRAPHSMKLNNRYVKNALDEIHKLRKEKQALKSDPMYVLGYKTIQTEGENKVQKMKDTIFEIEKVRSRCHFTYQNRFHFNLIIFYPIFPQRLQAKRGAENRSAVLEELTADELVQEKTAVQRALLYLESLYGRPNTREERDAARMLYNRYRIIKRLVNRSVTMAGAGMNNPSELPTILEHEAMAFTVAAISLTPPPSDTEAMSVLPSSVDSPTDPASVLSSTDSTDTSSSINENVHDMSLEELSRNLDVVRDEKKKLRRAIKEYEQVFEEQNGRKMLKTDRNAIEDTYALYKQKKAKLRLLDALVRKQLTK